MDIYDWLSKTPTADNLNPNPNHITPDKAPTSSAPSIAECSDMTFPFTDPGSDVSAPPTARSLRQIINDLGMSRDGCTFRDVQITLAVARSTIPQQIRDVYDSLQNHAAPFIKQPTNYAEQVEILAALQIDDPRLDNGAFTTDARAAAVGPSNISLRQAVSMLRAAIRTERIGNESSWNANVHLPLIRCALPPCDSEGNPCLIQTDLFNYTEIDSQYRPANGVNKKVDVCLFIDPSAVDMPAAMAIRTLRQQCQLDAIHHLRTSRELVECPFVCGIETKSNGDGKPQEAEAQFAVWHCALRLKQHELLRLAARRAELVSDEDIDKYVEDAFDKLNVIHGVIARGHVWTYAAMAGNPVSGKQAAWIGNTIGSTRSIAGIYRITAFIEFLKRWITETYWVWFKKWILGIEQSP